MSANLIKILSFLKDNPHLPDNKRNDSECCRSICSDARASLVLEAFATSAMFPAFMATGTYHEGLGWVYPLPAEFGSPEEQIAEYRYSVSSFFICNTIGDSRNCWQLYPSSCYFYDAKGQKQRVAASAVVEKKEICSHISEERLLSCFKSKFKLCRKISPYKTAEQVCRFFGVNENVFSELKPGSQRVRQDFFHDEIKEHDNIGAQWITERGFSDETQCTNTVS